MEIIDELEPVRRGLYGGVVGYLDFAGDVDTGFYTHLVQHQCKIFSRYIAGSACNERAAARSPKGGLKVGYSHCYP